MFAARVLRVASPVSFLAAGLAFLVFSASATVRAYDPDRVKLTAEGGFRFQGDGQILTATGKVHLTYRDLTLAADSLQVYLDHSLVKAQGHVHYEKGQDKVDASGVVFDLKKESGTFLAVKSTYRGEDLKGDVFVVGDFMESSKSVLRLADSNLTTCDLAEPHYHLEAKEITVYLDDRLEARQVSYYERRTRLFTVPYLVIPLKKENQFELPRVGYSQTDGWFIKTTYNYYRSAAAFGAYFLDWYEKKGMGTGLKHNYVFGPPDRQGKGSGYLYVKGNRDHDDTDVYLGVDHQQKFGPGWNGAWRGNYQDEYLTDAPKQQTATSFLQVTQQTKQALTDLSANYRLQSDLRDFRVSFNTDQRLPHEWDWRFGASASRYYQVGKAAYDNLGYQTQLARAFPDFTFRLSAQQQFTPPQVAEGETPPPWNRYTRFPELALESRTLTYQGRPLPLNFTASLSRYEEFSKYHPEGYAQGLGSLTGRLTGLTYPLSTTLSTNLTSSGTATYYQNGDYTLGATVGPGLTYRPLPPVTANLRYNWQDRLGVNPFTSTGISPAQSVTGNATYTAGGLTADVSSGYNLLTSYYQDVVGRLTYVRGRTQASGTVSYDPNNQLWRRVSAIYAYQASETKLLKLGVTHDLENFRLERLDIQVAAPLTKLWRGEAILSYDGFSQSFTRGEVALTRDLHCREVRFRYDQGRGEIWAELRIKALPSQLLRLGASEEKLMFDSQSLGGLLGSETTTTGVPR